MRRIPIIAFVLLILPSAWGQLPNQEVLDRRARELGTDSPSARQAHEILRGGTARGFAFPTVVFGIEKAHRERIRREDGWGGFHSPEERAILEASELPEFCSSGKTVTVMTPEEARQCELFVQGRKGLASYLDDGKRTFVSHIAYWAGPKEATPILLHNAYLDCSQEAGSKDRSAVGKATGNGFDCGRTVYDNSWGALDRLAPFLGHLVDREEFTHLLLISKGWNTNQGKSVEDYRELPLLISNEAQKASRRFHPLVVGITWHSGWVWGVSKVPLLKAVPNVASYGNKAKDADEIGITWVNALLNRVLLSVAAQKDLPVVAIGHSFGARIVTRAGASAGLIGVEAENRVSLLISLQGAFSMNRFLPERCSGTEGAPYADLTDKVDRVVLVWSDNDRTNPLAQMVSQANHVGGSPGHRRARAYPDRFRFRRWESGWVEPQWSGSPWSRPLWPRSDREGKECASFHPPDKPVEVIDASPIVKSHGDVIDSEMAALLWTLMEEGRL